MRGKSEIVGVGVSVCEKEKESFVSKKRERERDIVAVQSNHSIIDRRRKNKLQGNVCMYVRKREKETKRERDKEMKILLQSDSPSA